MGLKDSTEERTPIDDVHPPSAPFWAMGLPERGAGRPKSWRAACCAAQGFVFVSLKDRSGAVANPVCGKFVLIFD